MAHDGAIAAEILNSARAAPSLLDRLESEAVYILREAAAEFAKRALLFSGGKDSAVVLRLARKAFAPGPPPFPLLHVDTGHGFPELLEFRDHAAAAYGARLIVASVQDSIDRGRVVERAAGESRNAMQAVTLLDAIAEHGFDARIGGARRDEEKARAKERVFSHRDAFGQWDPRNQRPEPWVLYNARLAPGENMRVFPLSDWTEHDVWEYIVREAITLPNLYFAHRRQVVRRNGRLFPVSELLPVREGELVETLSVRFRTVGDMSCTCPVESTAAGIADVVAEVAAARVSERGATRADDDAEAAMERRKRPDTSDARQHPAPRAGRARRPSRRDRRQRRRRQEHADRPSAVGRGTPAGGPDRGSARGSGSARPRRARPFNRHRRA
jgi:sulfate adenylyltransferase subunit 2